MSPIATTIYLVGIYPVQIPSLLLPGLIWFVSASGGFLFLTRSNDGDLQRPFICANAITETSVVHSVVRT
jgi:hypothetical protein